MNIVDIIPEGKANRIDRHQLIDRFAREMNVSVRSAERSFHYWLALIRQNAVVISSGSGYYRPTPEEMDDIEHYIKKEKHRMLSVNNNLKYAEKYLADLKSGRIK